MTKTQNYQLNQWEATDSISRADFNADNAAIDAALGVLAASVAASGNCRIAWGSYTGDGTYGVDNPIKLEVDFMPVVVVIGSDGYVTKVTDPSVWVRGRSKAMACSNGTTNSDIIQVTWSDNGLSWYCATSSSFQNNQSGYTYHYAVLGVAA